MHAFPKALSRLWVTSIMPLREFLQLPNHLLQLPSFMSYARAAEHLSHPFRTCHNPVLAFFQVAMSMGPY